MKSTESQGVLRETATGSVSSLHVGCPVCGQSYLFPLSPPRSSNAALHCDGCRCELAIETSDLSPCSPVEKCAVCSSEEFYVQKDFNRVLGLWVVVLSGLISFGVMLQWGHIPGLGVLFLVTLIDWLIFRRLRNVAVCYLCNTIYRGFPGNPEHQGFYLGDEERHKKLRQEWIEGLRRPEVTKSEEGPEERSPEERSPEGRLPEKRSPERKAGERDPDERSTVS